MSTKSTLVLTNMNEHWYYEHSDETFVLEFDAETSSSDEMKEGEEQFEIIIKKDTPLWKLLNTLRDSGTIREAEKAFPKELNEW
jgi:hypothetical protein